MKYEARYLIIYAQNTFILIEENKSFFSDKIMRYISILKTRGYTPVVA